MAAARVVVARIAVTLYGAAFASACDADIVGDAPSAQERRAVIDGDVDLAHDEVVAIVLDGVHECTGVVIGPHLVLTAAHCARASASLAVRIGPDAEAGVELAVSATALHRAETVDLAVFALALSSPVDAAVVSPRRVDHDLVGETVTVVGYGTAVPLADGTSGVRRVGESRVVAVEPHEFRTEADPGSACSGDSGGPAYERLDDDTERIVGIVQGGEPSTCADATFTRVDGAAAELVTRAIAETRAGKVALGGRCLFAGHCADGECATRADGDARVCAAACASSEDCDEDATCGPDLTGALRCFDDAPPSCDPCAAFAAACGADLDDCELRVVVPPEPASCGAAGGALEATAAVSVILGVFAWGRRGRRAREPRPLGNVRGTEREHRRAGPASAASRCAPTALRR